MQKSSIKGLSENEVAKRLTDSASQLPAARKASGLKILLSQFHNALIYILLIAGGISWFLGDVVDAEVILAAVLIR